MLAVHRELSWFRQGKTMAAGKSSDASICLTPRRVVAWMRRVGVEPTWRDRSPAFYRSCDGDFDRCADVVNSDKLHRG
ncbi:hypothetical protein DXU07_46195 [Bradyrhizobium elkanii]